MPVSKRLLCTCGSMFLITISKTEFIHQALFTQYVLNLGVSAGDQHTARYESDTQKPVC